MQWRNRRRCRPSQRARVLARAHCNPRPTQTEPALPVSPKRPAHYQWAVLMARIYEVFPLLCPICGGQMRIIAFITTAYHPSTGATVVG